MKIVGIYRITNTVTGDFYIGSSKDVKHRWARHKCPSSWNEQPNNQLYKDMQKYGLESFVFEILTEAEPEKLKEIEQQFIEKLKPTYNQMNAKGLDIEKRKKSNEKFQKSDKRKEYQKEYRKSDKYKKYQKEYKKEYEKTDKRKEYKKQYNNQLCLYNDEVLTLNALASRFRKAGIEHSTIEAKKYLL